MADSTARAGLPFPEGVDPNDVPADMQALATRVAALLGAPRMSTLDRDALEGADLYDGRVIVNTDSGQPEIFDADANDGAGAWISVMTTAGGSLAGAIILPATDPGVPGLRVGDHASGWRSAPDSFDLIFVRNGADHLEFGGSAVRPVIDGAIALGLTSQRWSTIEAADRITGVGMVSDPGDVTGETEPSGFPPGLSVRQITSAGSTGLPHGGGMLLTYNITRGFQLTSEARTGATPGRAWLRVEGAGGTWGPWAELARIDENHQLLVRDGSAATPGIAFRGDSDTGAYREPNFGNLALVADGVQTIMFGATAVTPGQDDTSRLGGSSKRWTELYATNGTINTSDEEAKADVADDELGIEFVRRLKPTVFRWQPGGRPHHGLGAGQVRQVLDELEVDDFAGYIDPAVEARGRVNPWADDPDPAWVEEQATDLTDDDADADELEAARQEARDEWARARQAFDDETDAMLAAPKGLRYHEFVGPLIKAVQEQQQQIDGLRQELHTMQQRVRDVEVASEDARKVRDAVTGN